jgi:hypothetical protein
VAHRSLEETIAAIAPSRKRGIPNPPTIGVGVSGDNGDLANALSQAGQQIQQLQTAYQQQSDLITQNTQALQGNTSSHSGSAASTLSSIASNLFGGALGILSPIISGITSLFGGSSTPAALPIYTPPPPVSINGVLQSAAPASSGTAAATPASTLSPAGQQVAQLQQSVAAPPAQPEANSSDGFSGAALGYLSQIASSLTTSTGTGTSAAVPVSGVPQPQAASTQSQGASLASGQSGAGGTQSNAAPQITVNVSAMDSQSFMDRSDDIASAVRAAMLNMHPINDVVADL